jgi:hypothetical protein
MPIREGSSSDVDASGSFRTQTLLLVLKVAEYWAALQMRRSSVGRFMRGKPRTEIR